MFSSDNVADILEVHAASLHLQCGRVSVYIQVYVLRKCLGRGSESKIVQRKNQQLQGSQIAWKDYQQLLIRHKIVYLPCEKWGCHCWSRVYLRREIGQEIDGGWVEEGDEFPII